MVDLKFIDFAKHFIVRVIIHFIEICHIFIYHQSVHNQMPYPIILAQRTSDSDIHQVYNTVLALTHQILASSF